MNPAVILSQCMRRDPAFRQTRHPMNILLRSIAIGMLTACSVAFAADFPQGSPAFEHKLSAALAKAKSENKPVVAVFSAVWCGPCQAMKKSVYPSDAVKPYHDKFVWVYIDTDEKSNAADAEKYGVSGIPHIQFLDKGGKALDQQVGSSSPKAFADTLEGVLKKAK
jgi:thiol:disulfide interchange protein